ncbi:hypothetical protein FACS189487_05780 [Campylobacterota bacterium]|nr:hypothetical protein FACS189487_05780 [Campylobacterota bacterium]
MKKYNSQIMSWAPFAEGKNDMFRNKILCDIGAKYKKSAGQTALRFLVQSSVAVIPKSVRKERMAENFDIFDFALTEDDMAEIKKLDMAKSLFFRHDIVGFIKERGDI